MELSRQLQQGLAELKLSLSDAQQQQCLDYLQLLEKWNQAYNLSAVRDLPTMLSRHLLDSLSVVPHFHIENCADVGSGAGLPGIPLAIALPDREFTLIDSNGKKTRFLHQAVQSLRLENVTVEQCRVEEKSPPPIFAGLISRAFSTINAMLDNCSQLVAEGGWVYAMKGRHPADELKTIPSNFSLDRVEPLAVPGESGERHLVILRKK